MFCRILLEDQETALHTLAEPLFHWEVFGSHEKSGSPSATSSFVGARGTGSCRENFCCRWQRWSTFLRRRDRIWLWSPGGGFRSWSWQFLFGQAYSDLSICSYGWSAPFQWYTSAQKLGFGIFKPLDICFRCWYFHLLGLLLCWSHCSIGCFKSIVQVFWISTEVSLFLIRFDWN